MPPIDFNFNTVADTDTFTQWKNKCNEVIEALNAADFITAEDGVVTVGTTQTITGQKTFSQSLNLKGFTNIGNFNSNGASATVNASTLTFSTINSAGSITFVNSAGINLKASSTSASITLGYTSAGSPEKLIFNYTAGGGVFEIADGNKLSLAGSEPTLRLNGYDLRLPSAAPVSDSVLQFNSATPSIGTWQAKTDLVEEVASSVTAAFSAEELTLPVNLIPVGTMIAVDSRILNDWNPIEGEYLTDVDYPGWIPCNGQVLSFDDAASPPDVTYKELIQRLDPTQSGTSGSATLPNTFDTNSPHNGTGPIGEAEIGGNVVIYLIKYKQDAVTTFSIESKDGNGKNGIQFYDNDNAPVASIGIAGGLIGLNVDTDYFDFNTAGALTFSDEAISSNASANTIAKRDASGNIKVGEPTDPEHAVTKLYVDSLRGNSLVFPELTNGGGYADYNNSFSFIDNGHGRVIGGQVRQRLGSGTGEKGGKFNFAAFSPITNKACVWKRTYPNPAVFHFVDEDDIVYGVGYNGHGQIGHKDRGKSSDYSDYYAQFTDAAPYDETDVEDPIPAFLPPATIWPANAVTVDWLESRIEPFWHEYGSKVLKTKDGIERSYIGGQRTAGFEKKYIDSTEIPYTRGWILSCGQNSSGQHGTGGGGEGNYSTYNTGPWVWGIDSAGRSLWATFALTDAERGTSSSWDSTKKTQINKRFNYFKPNAVKQYGLSNVGDAEALTTWRSSNQCGFSGSESFTDYSWYIKKARITHTGIYVIVGKPGNESDNEIWHAGYNALGNAGNGTTEQHYDFVPACATALAITGKTFSTVGSTGNTVFQSSSAHGFKDLEVIQIGTSFYYIARGNASNINVSTQFRLFSSASAAVTSILNGGTSGAYANANIGASTLKHGSRYKGIFDFSVSVSQPYWDHDTIIARRTTDSTTNTNLLDALPEQDLSSIAVVSWGYNGQGQCGVNSTTNVLNPTPIFSLGTSDRPVATYGIICGSNTFIITEDTGGVKTLYGAGQLGHGLLDKGTLTGNQLKFQKCAICDSWNIRDFYVTHGTWWNTGYVGQVHAVCELKNDSTVRALFSGGWNANGMLGGNFNYGAYTPNFKRVPFPEDPANIVAINKLGLEANVILCKDRNYDLPETAEELAAKPGRIYGAGNLSWFIPGGNVSNGYVPLNNHLIS